jgi:hypothetical protein
MNSRLWEEGVSHGKMLLCVEVLHVFRTTSCQTVQIVWQFVATLNRTFNRDT